MAAFKSVEEIAKEVNSKLGDNVLVLGRDVKKKSPRLPTGILSLDLATGGGLPVNSWTQIVGENAQGKTTTCHKIIAYNQAINPDFVAMWVAAEEFVPELALPIGVDMDRLWLIESNVMEEALAIVLKTVENRAVDMVVIDSIPAMTTEVEDDEGLDNKAPALQARLLGKFFRKCARAAKRSLTEDDRPCTLIAINQYRDAIGVMHGDPRTTPGGKAKDYWYFLMLDVKRDEWIKTGSDLSTRVGQTIAYRVTKNKLSAPHQRAQVDFYFKDTEGFKMGEFDHTKDVVNVCLALDVFESPRYSFEGVKLASKKEDLYAVVREDLDLQEKLWKAALDGVLPQDGDDNEEED